MCATRFRFDTPVGGPAAGAHAESDAPELDEAVDDEIYAATVADLERIGAG